MNVLPALKKKNASGCRGSIVPCNSASFRSGAPSQCARCARVPQYLWQGIEQLLLCLRRNTNAGIGHAKLESPPDCDPITGAIRHGVVTGQCE